MPKFNHPMKFLQDKDLSAVGETWLDLSQFIWSTHRHMLLSLIQSN